MSLALDHGDGRSPEDVSRTPTWVLRCVILILFGLLAAQLWRLQIVDGRAYSGRSAMNYLRTAVIPPQRGVIYDRNRTLLTTNAPNFVVSITPADMPSDRAGEIVIRVANELRVPPADIQRLLDQRKSRNDYSPFAAIPVRSGVGREAVMRLAERSVDMPGVQVRVESTRRYTDGPLVSHLLGYMSAVSPEDATRLAAEGYSPDDRVGAAGVEKQYESILRGTPGKRLYQVEATGQEVAELRRDEARPGNSLMLTLDLELQRDVLRFLEEGLRNEPRTGAAVVLDPRNGEVLAMASTPTFDNNIINDPTRDDELEVLLKDEQRMPMFPRAFGGQYAPGSVFKLVTGSAALQEGVANRDTIIESKGVMYVARDEYPQIKDPFVDNAAWGKQNFIQGLANSSNIYFFWLGGGYEENGRTIFDGLGVDKLAQYARAFGYGAQTGLDVQGEKDGIVPSPAWKQLRSGQPWYKGDTYNMSIGQGFVLSTPLQVANATAAIANGGTLFQPHVVREVLDADGNTLRTIAPQSRPVPVDGGNLALMREAMEAAFQGPHLKDFLIPGLRAGGKTGTAEFGVPDENNKLPTHGWFTAFAPVDNPEIAVAVFVERGTGTTDASPIGARILRRYFNLPDSPAAPPPTPAGPPPAGAARPG